MHCQCLVLLNEVDILYEYNIIIFMSVESTESIRIVEALHLARIELATFSVWG